MPEKRTCRQCQSSFTIEERDEEFYIKMSVRGETRDAFSARSLDCVTPKQHFRTEIVEHSRKIYARPKKKVEEMLRKWDEAGGKDLSQEAWFTGAQDEAFAPPII